MPFVYIILIILSIIFAGCIGFLIGLNIAKKAYDILEDKLKTRIYNLLRENRSTRSSLDHYKSIASENNKMANHYRNLYNQKCHQIRINKIDDNTLKEAFKKLMIYSHPDKGICKDSSDFVKYKEIYDKIR